MTLKTKVSKFSSTFSPSNPESISLIDWVATKDYYDDVMRIREVRDKAERDRMKLELPGITPSGLFSYRKKDCLLEYSGYLQVDIDSHHQKEKLDTGMLKSRLSMSPYIAYVGLSTGGSGLWSLIPISNPDRHRDHFLAIREDFEAIGVELDGKVCSIVSLRLASYDPDPYINDNARVYERLKVPEVRHYNLGEVDNSEIMEMVKDIVDNNWDITGSYEAWFQIGCALANEMGEDGRGVYHMISQFNASYDADDCDLQFDRCLKSNYPYTIATFIQLLNVEARKHGKQYYSSNTKN